ncbi:hypothetical protein Y032_0134g1814 [Ancylostoma ceylanicum]|uniref:Uncharacterized protein n=1 Tax=Ancylostoma ceylanicum TaxID=53326 RepID=A0A016T5R1_9BILA|nr:hypothetical protein Y032_0134g1814 [Ancylostoma ceylanicum]
MAEDITIQDKSDRTTPFFVFFAIGFLYGLLLAYMHTRMVNTYQRLRTVMSVECGCADSQSVKARGDAMRARGSRPLEAPLPASAAIEAIALFKFE